jgi:diacylglycerol O-acyltransferase
MHRLSIIDAGFLMTETPNSPKHVGGVQVLQLPRGKGPAWLRRLLEDIKAVPPGFPFNQRLRDDNLLAPALVTDDHFDIDYHVRHNVLPAPGSDEQLVQTVARLHANLLDRERPLWEFHLIEGLRGRRFAFYTKVHHAIADGVTFARWFAESGSPSASTPDSTPLWARNEPPDAHSGQGHMFDRLLQGARSAGSGVRTAIDISALGARLLQKSLLQGDRDAVLPLGAGRTALNVPTGAARNFSICRYPLEEFKAIAHSQQASINDFLMALCDLAVNRYLAGHGAAPERPLVALMPVSLRDKTSGQGNLISLLQVKLASNHEDLLAVLREVSEASRSTRNIYGNTPREAVQLYSLAVNLLPLGEEFLHLGRLLPPIVNLVISNVPGPRQALYFRGAQITEVYPVNTLPPSVALSMTVCSYGGTLYFGLIAGRSAIPDLPRLTQYLDEAYAEFRSLTLG